MTTPTQGEHAQTALAHAAGLESFSESLPAYGFNPQPLKDAAETIRRLHAQVAAITAAPSVSDVLRTLHEAILNRLSHAELLEKAHYLMELNSNQARTIGELQDLVEAAPAQPAAPQGVAYAELPPTWAQDLSLAVSLLGMARTGKIPSDAASTARWSLNELSRALASNGQAPAGAAPEKVYLVATGLTNEAGTIDLYERHDKFVPLADCEVLYTAPTAQAAPAAGHSDDFWPVDGKASRTQLIDQIGQMNFRLTALRQENAGLIKRVQGQAEALRNNQGAAPADGAVAGMPPGISALMCVISSLRDTAHFSDEEGKLTDELRTLRDWAMTQAAAPTPAAQADIQPAPAVDGCTDPYSCKRCMTHPDHRGDMEHAGIPARDVVARAARNQGGV